MKGKPVLVLANKQDLGGTTSGDQLLQQLGLAEPAEDSPILPHMVKHFGKMEHGEREKSSVYSTLMYYCVVAWRGFRENN